jgi:hypothetical protein
LEYLLDQRLATIPQHQWASKLIGFDFMVEFYPGANNVVVDALSHHDTKEERTLLALSTPLFLIFDDIHQEINSNLDMCALNKEVAEGAKGDQWRVADDLIIVGRHVFIPSGSPSLKPLLASAHSAGHEGTEKKLHRFRADFHTKAARGIVHACVTC